MKIRKPPKAKFRPITIIFETGEEIASLFAVLNHYQIATAAGFANNEWEKLKNINNLAGNPDIDYTEKFNALERLIKH